MRELLVTGACFVGFCFYHIFLCVFGVHKVECINMLFYLPHPNALVATKSISICAGLRIASISLRALSASKWVSFLPLSQLNGGINVGYGPVRALFLSLILFPILVH